MTRDKFPQDQMADQMRQHPGPFPDTDLPEGGEAPDQETLPALHVHRALALVEQALRSEAAARAVSEQTGGNAPELVQGILDGVWQLRSSCREARAEAERLGKVYARHGEVLAERDALRNRGEALAKEMKRHRVLAARLASGSCYCASDWPETCLPCIAGDRRDAARAALAGWEGKEASDGS